MREGPRHMHRRELLRGSLTVGLASLGGALVLRSKRARAAQPALWGAEAEALATPGAVVETKYGRVQGRTKMGIYGFRGVPYGGRVDGKGRLKAPPPPESWTGVMDCTRTGPRAVQPFGNLFQSEVGDYFAGGQIGELGLNDQMDSENCLVLNVLTPQIGGGRRPVLVYIHGGGFDDGSGVIAVGAYRFPREQDVVLVSLNHRLNVFGYLYLGEFDKSYADSGNVGILDLVLALEWIRDNIEAFGGDPNNVMIFGESGGGGKVSTLLAMPAAKGLFHKAVVESGSLLDAQPADEAAKAGDAVLKELGISRRHVDRIAEVPTDKLFNAGQNVRRGLRPVIDGKNLSRNPFNPDAPPTAAGIPMIIGNCNNEENWLMGNRDPRLFSMNAAEGRERLLPILKLPKETVAEVWEIYRKDFPYYTAADIFFKVAGDGGIGRSALDQVERKLAQGDGVYRYLEIYPTPIEGGKYMAFHTSELPLVFRLVMYPESDELSQALSGAWAAFARTGDPSQPGLAWPRFSLANRETMMFDVESRVENDPQRAERLFWSKQPRIRFF